MSVTTYILWYPVWCPHISRFSPLSPESICKISTAIIHGVNQPWWPLPWCLQHSGLVITTVTIYNTSLLLLHYSYCYHYGYIWNRTIKGHIVNLEPKLHHFLFIHTLVIQYSKILPHSPGDFSEHFPIPAKRPNNTCTKYVAKVGQLKCKLMWLISIW